jgi:hypothetical protein
LCHSVTSPAGLSARRKPTERAKPALAASAWKKTPEIIDAIEILRERDTAGDPITGLNWTRKTTEKIAECGNWTRWSIPQDEVEFTFDQRIESNYNGGVLYTSAARTMATERRQVPKGILQHLYSTLITRVNILVTLLEAKADHRNNPQP